MGFLIFLIIAGVNAGIATSGAFNPCEGEHDVKECESRIKAENNYYYRYGPGAKGKF